MDSLDHDMITEFGHYRCIVPAWGRHIILVYFISDGPDSYIGGYARECSIDEPTFFVHGGLSVRAWSTISLDTDNLVSQFKVHRFVTDDKGFSAEGGLTMWFGKNDYATAYAWIVSRHLETMARAWKRLSEEAQIDV